MMDWTPELEIMKQRAIADGYFYWDKKQSGGGVVYADHCIYNRDATTIVARSYDENWAWVYAFRAWGWLPEPHPAHPLPAPTGEDGGG